MVMKQVVTVGENEVLVEEVVEEEEVIGNGVGKTGGGV